MTKMIAVLLSILLFVTPVIAEGYDISSMTDEELSSLYEEVVGEMNSRALGMSAKIYPGVYKVGVDIKPGRYVFKYVQGDYDCYSADVYIYENAETYEHNEISQDHYLHPNQTISIELRNDMIVEIFEDALVVFTTPTPFWNMAK